MSEILFWLTVSWSFIWLLALPLASVTYRGLNPSWRWRACSLLFIRPTGRPLPRRWCVILDLDLRSERRVNAFCIGLQTFATLSPWWWFFIPEPKHVAVKLHNTWESLWLKATILTSTYVHYGGMYHSKLQTDARTHWTKASSLFRVGTQWFSPSHRPLPEVTTSSPKCFSIPSWIKSVTESIKKNCRTTLSYGDIHVRADETLLCRSICLTRSSAV
jgi:hypothetical protein